MGDLGTLKMLRICASAATFLFFIFSFVAPILAHPHMWVDLESRVILDDEHGDIDIQQIWLFDDFFSTAVIVD